MRKVSVLIPTYRPKDYLLKCLESLDKQVLDKSHFRVYIGLNGEQFPFENFVLDVLSEFSFDYEYFYICEAGVSNARNFLINRSGEDYIVFIDDDDLVSPTYLKELLEVSTQEILGISNIYNFESDLSLLKNNYIGLSFNEIKQFEKSKYKARKYFSSPCAKMIHRDMIGGYRFDPKVAKGEDSLFMALISPNIKALNKTSINACYYVYERPGSTTRTKNKKMVEIETLNYLFLQYLKLFFNPKYKTVFIMTRMLATVKKYIQLFGNIK